MNKPYYMRFGKIWPLGIPVSHSWDSIGAIFAMIQELHIKTFYELGVEKGGLAALLVMRAQLQRNFRYVGFEKESTIDRRVAKMVGNTRTAQFYQADIFKEHIIGLIRSHLKVLDHPALIYCDNGNKPLEIRTFAPLLYSGDYIAAHDFGNEYFLEDVISTPDVERVEAEWVADETNIILFRRLNDNN